VNLRPGLGDLTRADLASRAEALDVRIAVSGKLFDGAVEGVHLFTG
jgi:hypothetical protein